MAGPAYFDAFRRIVVQPDNITISADAVDDTLTLVAGAGISLVANAGSDQITIVNTNTSSPTNDLFAKRLTVDGIVIDTNVITGTDSNADLELDANGTGAVSVIGNLKVSGVLASSSTKIAIGSLAGNTNQGSIAVAIGDSAGETDQGSAGVAIGYYAGKTSQETGAVAIGYTTAQITQRTGAVAIGWSAGQTNQGANAIAIGYRAGFTNQNASSIVLNASGVALEAPGAGLFVNPVRSIANGKPLMYDTANSELAYSSALEFNGTTISTADSSAIKFDGPVTFQTAVTVDDNLTVGGNLNVSGTIIGASTPTSVVTSNIALTGANAYTLTASSAATPLTITVTPSTTTSLVTVTFQFTWHPSEPESSGSTGMELYIYKNGVQQASSQYVIFTSGNGDVYNSYPVHYSWPDISGTTSPITYTVYAKKTGGNGGTIGNALGSLFPCWATIIG